MQSPQPPGHQPRSSATELAKERNRAAAERTLMAWIRTSLSLISFGFGIDQIVKALNRAVSVNHPVQLSQFLGLSFIILGTFSVLGAAVQYQQETRALRKQHYTYVPRISIGLIVAGALFLIGLVAFIGILLKAKL
ncbi:MAG: DUF202 domain-containing protein [Phormidesmis sp.]